VTQRARRPGGQSIFWEAPSDVSSTRLYFIWLLVAIFFEYARPASFVPGLDALKPYSLLPASLFLIVSFSSNRALRPWSDMFSDPLAKWICIYVALIFLSITHAPVTTQAFEMFTVAVGYVIYFFLILRIVVTRGRLLGVFFTLLVAHLFLVVMNPQFVLDPSNRYYIIGATFLGDTNDYTLSLCILAPMVIELALQQRSMLLKVFFWFVLVVIGLAIVSSQSRGAALGISAVLIYLWLISPRKMLTLTGFVLLAGVMLLYASDAFFERMSTIKDYEQEGSAMGRITAWKAAVEMVLDHPILGVGSGHFSITFGTSYMPRDIVGPYPWLTAHSIYFLILAELGIPGIVTLLVLIFGNMRTNSRIRRTVLDQSPDQISEQHKSGARTLYLLNASMVGFAVAGAFLSAAYYPHIYVLTALMIVQRREIMNGLKLDLTKSAPIRRRRPATARPA